MYDLIIFDCDGTLTDSEEGYFGAFSETLEHYGFTPPANEIYQTEYAGKILKDIIALFFDQSGQIPPDGFAAHHLSLEPKYINAHTRAIEGASDAVATLRKIFPVCIASNASVAAIKNGLGIVGMADYFSEEIIFSKDHVEEPKPSPQVYLHAARMMNVDPAKVIVIEDSSAGTIAGTAAGMHVIGFGGSSQNVQGKIDLLNKVGAKASFGSWAEILSYISSLTGKKF